MQIPDFEEIASVDEFDLADRIEVFLEDTPILLIQVNDQYFAIEDVCTHDGQPLTDGSIEEGEIVCPRHGARFDISTGKALCLPATKAIQTFEVEVRGRKIFARAKTITD
ncbi:MAG: non-heme iron oxygenase ferredoxin subunit [Planctomycetes bacterium]|nr:non-heme iron oxygenase ferredoxin subunit [Planctomycetota bacterium]MCH9728053.1 non-heme iron oxygenase ferredoxin subunit [Planctomycetota bacterium]MCH9775855.1 non-heme iron oxygenase ferredoxin subunit [Planctomycetota bacterium]MCH9792467.1 non-heme iron oxygenase ferredoxin subunit [Planctomycetota bacterium]MDF1743234.1 non-heme iron oxygenase ferredoxin subunit [Gimesia sp.]